MEPVSSVVNLRFIFITVGAIVLIISLLKSQLLFTPNTRLNSLGTQLQQFADKCKNRWPLTLALLTLFYFIIAGISKFTQYQCSIFSGQDFWLFDDMLYWMSKGFPYITRFAAQAEGPLQHGAIHPFLTWFFTIPLVWIFGPTTVAIIYNAAVLALGGCCLGYLSFQRTRSSALALILPLTFWMSEWTGRTLQYETHPEAAYPLLVFVVALPFFVNARTWQRVLLTAFVWICLVGLKQDALVIAGCLWLWLTLSKQISSRLSGLILLIILSISFEMGQIVTHFKDGLGAASVQIGSESFPVALPSVGSGVLGGHTLSDIHSVMQVLQYMIESNGGFWSLIKNIFHYFTTSPFIPFLLLAPWTIFNRWFWILVFPLSMIYAVLGGQSAGMQNYYAIPLASLFWVVIVIGFSDPSIRKRTLRRKATWVFCFAAFYGNTAPSFYRANPGLLTLQISAKQAATYLEGPGIVSSRLLPVVERDKVWCEKPIFKSIPANVRWALLPKSLRSYEDNDERHATWKHEALASGKWTLYEQDGLELYQRKRRAN